MATLLKDLVIDRVDLVDEGANSEAHIELYKRKENVSMDLTEILKGMKPEEAAVVQAEIDGLKLAKEKSDKEKEELEVKLEEACTEDKKEVDKASFDEEHVMKSMPDEVKALLNIYKTKAETAEEEVRKANEAKAHSQAVSKANNLKALPVESGKLVELLKKCPDDIYEVLEAANNAIVGTTLEEVGKSNTASQTANQTSSDAWEEIEKKANEKLKGDTTITKQKAVSLVIVEEPELYKRYLDGGAN